MFSNEGLVFSDPAMWDVTLLPSSHKHVDAQVKSSSSVLFLSLFCADTAKLKIDSMLKKLNLLTLVA